MTTKKQTTKRAPSAKTVVRKPAPKAAATAKKPTKADRLIEMLRRPKGASIEELMSEFGTQPHSIRAAISIEKRKRELTIALTEGRYRVMA